MPTCPGGHQTEAADFCEVCGIRVDGPAQAAPAAGSPAAAERCPRCGADRTGPFCEACGYSFAAAAAVAAGQQAAGQAPPAGVRADTAPSYMTAAPGEAPAPGAAPGAGPAFPLGAWTAVVTADRAYFDSVIAAQGPDAGAVEFPAYCPERHFRLSGSEMRVGRRSAARGLEPEIDLTGPPADPGVSHLHAVLTAEQDGGWTVLDPGSANGTRVNGREIPAGARVRLSDGDRVCVGAWTMLTIRAG